MDEDKGWLLKILTGPHVGAEAILTSGTYLLGRAESCDIVLHDTSLAEQHFRLSIETDNIGLSVIAKDYPYYIDGVKVDSDSIEINPYQVISTGTFFFVLGSVDETWPPVELQGAQRNLAQVEEKANSETTTDDHRRLSSPRLLKFIPTAWMQNYNRPINRIYLAVGIALIGMGLSLSLTVFTEDNIPVKNLSERSVEINKLLGEYLVDATVDTVYKDGQKTLYIHGYAQTDEQRDAFMEALGKAKITVQTKLYTFERLKHAVSVVAEQFLDPRTDTIEVSSVGGASGKVKLSGYVAHSDVLERVLDMIKIDVPGLRGYENEVRTMDDAVYALDRMLAEDKLSDKADINIAENIIYLSPKTSDDTELYRLTTLPRKFQQRFGTRPQLVYKEKEKPKIKRIKIDAVLQSVSFGKSPYLETQDGKRYTVGAVIDDDYVIKEINRKFILLSKDGELGRYYFNSQSPMSTQ